MYRLTALDIAAIRNCDRITVHAYGKDTGKPTRIRAIKDAPAPTAREPFPRETEYALDEIPVSFGGYGGGTYDNANAFASVSVAYSNTPLNMLKAGQEIALTFRADNNTDYLRDAGLHHDDLILHVACGMRKCGPSVVTARLADITIASSTCPDNSARMVRGIRYREAYALA